MGDDCGGGGGDSYGCSDSAFSSDSHHDSSHHHSSGWGGGSSSNHHSSGWGGGGSTDHHSSGWGGGTSSNNHESAFSSHGTSSETPKGDSGPVWCPSPSGDEKDDCFDAGGGDITDHVHPRTEDEPLGEGDAVDEVDFNAGHHHEDDSGYHAFPASPPDNWSDPADRPSDCNDCFPNALACCCETCTIL